MSSLLLRKGITRLALRLAGGSLGIVMGWLILSGATLAQPPGVQASAEPKPAATPLAELLQEAEHNSPQLEAARQEWKAAQQVPTQVSTLPDPEFMVQHLSVGSPRPFSGYTNSEMAYVALGVSQEIPYPGKLRLRGEVAKRDAEAVRQQYESLRQSILAGVKAEYFQLAYLSKTLGILESDGALLDQVERAADARYRSGKGSQQDLLQAQLERTKLLREITMHHLDVAKSQARLKQLVGRSQASPDVEPADLPETPFPYTYDEILTAAKAQNPAIAAAEKMVERQKLQVDLAHKDFYPDFNVQYAWERPDPTQYRARYTVSVGVRIPIYRNRKQRPELVQAEAELSRSRSQHDAESQQVALQLRTAFDTAQKTAELLKIYREGLRPQARAEFQAGVAAYQNNRRDFQSLLASFLDVLQLDEGYWQSAAEYETALARVEELTGLSLRAEGAGQ